MTTTAEGSVMDMREAFEVLRNNVQSETGDVRIAGLRDNDEVRDALHFALSHIGDGSKAEPIARIKVKSDGIGTAYSVVRPESLPDGVYPVYLGPAPTAQDKEHWAVKELEELKQFLRDEGYEGVV